MLNRMPVIGCIADNGNYLLGCGDQSTLQSLYQSPYLESIEGYTEIDSEQMNCYKDTELKNDTVSGSGFPQLYPGDNTIVFGGGITSIEIIPRWVTL